MFDKGLTWFANLWFGFALVLMVNDIGWIVFTARRSGAGFGRHRENGLIR
jgi:hypothetical protein